MNNRETTDVAAFYDELAEYYDLIFEDWEASMARQGNTIASLISRHVHGERGSIQILDVAAGIGTQSLPLAKMGYRVTSRDISPQSINRLQREAAIRRLDVDTAVDDLRTLESIEINCVDVVLSFDNAVPHLLSDDEILSAFKSFHRVLKPDGLLALSVRDYTNIENRGDTVRNYGVRWRNGVRHILFQVWHWINANYYDLSFYVLIDNNPPKVFRTNTRYYAITTSRLLELMSAAGFEQCGRIDNIIYQPVLVGRRGN